MVLKGNVDLDVQGEEDFGLRGSGAEKFDIELRCRGQRWLTKADYPELGDVSPNQTVTARCDAAY